MARTFKLSKLPKRIVDGLLMQPWVSGPLHVFGNDLAGKRWLFVLGCYNAGTTLLAEMLQTHSRLDGMRNEGAFLTDSLPYPERLGWPRMWSECSDELRVPDDDSARARRIRRHWSLWVRGNPDVVVEKSISNVLRIDFLSRNFPDAKFVHIVRNGYAVAAGIRKKANLARWANPQGLTEYPIELCARQWSESLREVEAAEARGAQIISISYEALVADPVTTLAPVFEFAGVEPIRNASDWGTMHVHERSSQIRDMNAASIAALSDADKAKIRDVAGGHLRQYGYD